MLPGRSYQTFIYLTVSLTLEVCRGMGTTGIPQNPREWVQISREYRGDGTETCGVPAGMGFIIAGNPRRSFGTLGCDKYPRLYDV